MRIEYTKDWVREALSGQIAEAVVGEIEALEERYLTLSYAAIAFVKSQGYCEDADEDSDDGLCENKLCHYCHLARTIGGAADDE